MTTDLLFLLQQSPSDGTRSLFTMLWYVVGFGAIFYFFFIRPKVQQEKKHKQQIAQLRRGDKIITVGGIIGEVVHIKDDQLTVRSGESRLVIQRERVADILTPKGEAATTS